MGGWPHVTHFVRFCKLTMQQWGSVICRLLSFKFFMSLGKEYTGLMQEGGQVFKTLEVLGTYTRQVNELLAGCVMVSIMLVSRFTVFIETWHIFPRT